MATYTDYADHTDVFVKRRGSKGGLVFPVKLFLLLKYIDLKEPHLKAIISWNHHGRSFKIHDHMRFRQVIMPRFYTSTSDKTFRRQLNFWGFKTISAKEKGAENGSYYHEKFLRSKDYLCRQILRTSDRLPDSDEPDFERMKAMPSSDQHRLTTPESDDELFEILLVPSSNADAKAKRSNANISTSRPNMNSSLDSRSFPFNTNQQETALWANTTNSITTTSTTLNLQQASSYHPQLSSGSLISNIPASAIDPMIMNPRLNSNFLFSNNFSNQQASGVSSNLHDAHTSTDLASLNSSSPFSTYLNQQEALHMTTASYSSILPPVHSALLQMQQQTVNLSTANNDGSQAYQNINLEQLLSDENELQWRHLQPFPIGFQPPLYEGESEDMGQFMDFIRRKREEIAERMKK